MIKPISLKDDKMFQTIEVPTDSQILSFYYSTGELKLDYFDPSTSDSKDKYEIALSPLGYNAEPIKVPFFTYFGIVSYDTDKNYRYHLFYRKLDA